MRGLIWVLVFVWLGLLLGCGEQAKYQQTERGPFGSPGSFPTPLPTLSDPGCYAPKYAPHACDFLTPVPTPTVVPSRTPTEVPSKTPTPEDCD